MNNLHLLYDISDKEIFKYNSIFQIKNRIFINKK